MTRLTLKHIKRVKTRHGKTLFYFRRPGYRLVALPGAPGSSEFMDAYGRALDPKTAPRLEIGAARTKPGTIDALVALYYQSAEYAGLAKSTQATYRNIIERFRTDHGAKRVALLAREHVKGMVAKKAETPSAANNFLKMLRMLMAFAIDANMRKDDPTIGVKRVRVTSEGFTVWREQDIAAFRVRHALGTRARLAMEMGLNTMQRRGDLVRMGRQHVHGGTLAIRQEKTGTTIEIPVLPELQSALDLLPAGQLIFLETEQGAAFTPAGFGNWFREVCAEAGLPVGYNTHGLRKAGATRLADAGCSDHQIMAWGGWKSLSEVQRYTRAANRRRLAASAVHKLETRTGSANPPERFAKSAEFSF
jgi:integrase